MANNSSFHFGAANTTKVKTEVDENNEEDHKAYLQQTIEPWLTWGLYLLSNERPDKPLVWFHDFLMKHKDDKEPPSLEVSPESKSNGKKHSKLSSMSTSAYLKATVTTFVTCGMHELYLEKPENPIVWFAKYFLKYANSGEIPELV